MPAARYGRGTGSTENSGVHGTGKRSGGLVGTFLESGTAEKPSQPSQEIVVTAEDRAAHDAAWAANRDATTAERRTGTLAGPYPSQE